MGIGGIIGLHAVGLSPRLNGLCADAIGKVEATLIAWTRDISSPIKVQEAPNLIATIRDLRSLTMPTSLASTDKGFVDKCLCIFMPTSEEEFTYLRQMLGRIPIEG